MPLRPVPARQASQILGSPQLPQAVHLCATLENFRILEYEHDDVPWRDEIVTEPTVIRDGYIELSERPGLGCDIVEERIAEHPVEGSTATLARAMGKL